MTQTNPLILLNRETPAQVLQPGVPVWRQVEVNGEHPTVVEFLDGSARPMVQVIDNRARAEIVKNFSKLKADPGFSGVLVDTDHLSHDRSQSTEAKAWLLDLREGDDGQLYGLLDFTDVGAAAVRNKRFKFFSTEFDPDSIEWLDGDRFRPTQLVGLALTNRPNNKGGKPISNRGGYDPPAESNPSQDMKTIAEKLGLPAEATEEEILDAIASLQATAAEADGMKAEAEVEEILNRHTKRIAEGTRDEWKAGLIANREGTEKILAAQPEISAPEDKPEPTAPGRVFNRETSKTPSPVDGQFGDGAASDKDAEKRAARISNRARELVNNGSARNLTDAYRRAEDEIENEELADS